MTNDPNDVPWHECNTMFEWVEQTLQRTTDEDARIVALIQSLKPDAREPYRQLWKKYRVRKVSSS